MKHEMKISLPLYKQACGIFFVVILSLVRGVSYTYEIGIALEAPAAILAAALCADTYTQEITGKRSEIWRLYPMKNKIRSIYRRLLIQEIFLLSLSVLGYFLFFLFQNPQTVAMGQGRLQYELSQFLVYFAAAAVTLAFWGLFAAFLSCLFGNMWGGIGGCLILWLTANSSMGDRYFGPYNLFSYTFRNIEKNGDFTWIWGKIVCILIGFVVIAALPKIIEKRG